MLWLSFFFAQEARLLTTDAVFPFSFSVSPIGGEFIPLMVSKMFPSPTFIAYFSSMYTLRASCWLSVSWLLILQLAKSLKRACLTASMLSPLEQIVTDGKSRSVTGFAVSCTRHLHPVLGKLGSDPGPNVQGPICLEPCTLIIIIIQQVFVAPTFRVVMVGLSCQSLKLVIDQ